MAPGEVTMIAPFLQTARNVTPHFLRIYMYNLPESVIIIIIFLVNTNYFLWARK